MSGREDRANVSVSRSVSIRNSVFEEAVRLLFNHSCCEGTRNVKCAMRTGCSEERSDESMIMV